MYKVVSCGGDCFNCPWDDCIENTSDGAKTPFEIEQIELARRKKIDAQKRAKEESKRQREIDKAYSKWLKKNNIR